VLITIKELSILLSCSEKTGAKIAKEIRELYGVKYITLYHIADFFKLHPTHVVRWWISVNEKDSVKKIAALQKIPIPPVKKLDTSENVTIQPL